MLVPIINQNYFWTLFLLVFLETFVYFWVLRILYVCAFFNTFRSWCRWQVKNASELPFDGCSFFSLHGGEYSKIHTKKWTNISTTVDIFRVTLFPPTPGCTFLEKKERTQDISGKTIAKRDMGTKRTGGSAFPLFSLFFADCHTGKKIWEVGGSALIFLVWFWQPGLLDKRDIPGIKEAAVQHTLHYLTFGVSRAYERKVSFREIWIDSWADLVCDSRGREGRMGHLIPCPAFVKRGILWEGGRARAMLADNNESYFHINK